MKNRLRVGIVGLSAFFICLSCSDFGSEPWAQWRTVDLPGAQISLPDDAQLTWGQCSPSPCNPFWRVKTASGQLAIELDYHYWSKDLTEFRQSPGYWELPSSAGGFSAIRFGCEYHTNVWFGECHYVVGVLISGLARPEPLMVFARLEKPRDAEYAFQILCSIKGKSYASFYGELY